MTAAGIVLVVAEIITVIGFGFTVINFGGEGISAMSAFDFACKPCCFRFDWLCNALIIQALGTAFHPSR